MSHRESHKQDITKKKASYAKSICLHCLKSNKGGGVCCGYPMHNLGSRPRAPKLTAKKAEWKSFIQAFIHSTNRYSAGKIRKIIHLKNQYGVNPYDDEQILKTKLEQNDEVTTVFDNPKHLWHEVRYSKEDSDYQSKVKELVIESGEVDEYDVERGKEYFIFPGIIMKFDSAMIPFEWSYDIRKVTGASIGSTPAVKVHLDGSKELVKFMDYLDRSKINYRQRTFIFETKIEAIAFRSKYFQAIVDIMEEADVSYIQRIRDTIDVDFDRVLKKAPQLFL